MPEFDSLPQAFIPICEDHERRRAKSKTIGPDYYEPGEMENLDQYSASFDEQTLRLILKTPVKGTRYDERSYDLEHVEEGDPLRLKRDPNNVVNPNNILVMTLLGKELGSLSSELCDAIAPLFDEGLLKIEKVKASYLEKLSQRSRYAMQGILFVEISILFSKSAME